VYEQGEQRKKGKKALKLYTTQLFVFIICPCHTVSFSEITGELVGFAGPNAECPACPALLPVGEEFSRG